MTKESLVFQRLLVTVEMNGKSRQVAWNSQCPLSLDHPPQWFLVSQSGKIFLRRAFCEDGDKSYEISNEHILSKSKIQVKASRYRGKDFSIRLETLRQMDPIYVERPVPGSQKIREKGFSQPFIYWGSQQFLIGLQPMARKYRAHIGDRKVFELKRRKSGMEVVPYTEGIQYIDPSGEALTLQKGHPYTVTSSESLMGGGFVWANHWWRLNQVFTAEPVDLERAERGEHQEGWIWKGVNAALALILVGLSVLVGMQDPPAPVQAEKIKEVKVALKAPRVMPVVEEARVSSPPPRASKAPPKSPPRVSKIKPTMPKTPAPQASAQVEVAKSLQFLSSKTAMKPVKFSDRARPMPDRVVSSPSARTAFSSTVSRGHTPVELASLHQSSDVGDSLGGVKQLNDVRGVVSVAALYDSGSVDGLAGAVGGTGMSMSGEGQLAGAEIEKELSKHIHKFQYCYEKALLTKNHLGGILMMQWQISSFGNTSDVRVVRSELNDDPLHGCVSRHLSSIRFPSPKGGTVTVRYPFNFSSTSL